MTYTFNSCGTHLDSMCSTELRLFCRVKPDYIVMDLIEQLILLNCSCDSVFINFCE